MTSAGGHLSEVLKIDDAISSHEDSLWVTFDTPQAQSLLADRRVSFVDYVAPRDVAGSIVAWRRVREILKTEKFDACISTGAAVAAFALPYVALRGTPAFFVESLARATGPSATGRIMRAAPRVRTLSQYESWATTSWPFQGSIVDGWEPHETRTSQDGGRKILVTLGTIRPYRFDRAVDAVLRSLRAGDDVVWQLGATTRDDLPGDVHSELGFHELTQLASEADVVVSHAGVGSLLQMLELGKLPVLAVRSSRHGEHVDDHQSQIAVEMADRGLARLLDFSGSNEQNFETASTIGVSPTTPSRP
ncbi:glycosyltransferase [Subtercola boreus]|uniref:glycosyltransferase n=1 Tax=Subtercola boreus TaxID=120213 RepID=UPI001558CCC3|nr:glycosyltransferase [Subtercola boreus]